MDKRFINELIRIVSGALRLDVDKVRNYTAFLAEKLENEGEKTTAQRLRRLLEESDHQLRPVDAKFSQTLPVDAESRFPLIERVDLSSYQEPPVVLPEEQWGVINEFLSIARSYSQFDEQEIGGSMSLLMYGPPGTGKSRIARHVARELELDLYIARLDGLISSFLGSTSKNIRALFEFAERTPCILFLDEFDAIAKLRGDSQELGELKRVVNSFIQNLDSLGSHSIILAATNHQELLDAAVWRRFSYRIELDYPNPVLRRELWHHFLGSLEFEDRDVGLLVDLSEGFSGSDIEEVTKRLKRKRAASLENAELPDALRILQNLSIGEGEKRRFLSCLKGQDESQIAIALRERNPDLYSHAALARLFGVSKSTAYRRTITAEEEARNGRGT